MSETFELKISWKLPIPIAQAQSKYSIQPASEKSIAQHVNVRSKASKGQKVYKKRPGSGVGPKEAIKKDSTTIVNTMITGSHPSTLGHTPISNTSPPVMKKIRMISFGNLPAVRPCSERNLSKIQISREIPREKPRQIKSSTQAKPKIVRQ